MTFIECLAIPVSISIIFLLIFIAATLKDISMHSAYRNMMLEEIKEDIHKMYFAERIRLKNDHGIDLETFYQKYKDTMSNEEFKIRLKQAAKRNPDFDY